jgi:hypothetical protein
MVRILCFTRTSNCRAKELSMVAVFVVAAIVMFAVFVVAMIVIGKKWSGEQATVQQFKASLAKKMPPDVQADMEPRQLGLVSAVAIVVVVLPIFVAFFTATRKARAMLLIGAWLVMAVACAAWAASIARTWLERRYPVEMLVDLSPYPLAGAVRRNSWLGWVATVPMVLAFIPVAFTGFQTARDRLFVADLAAISLLTLLTCLMYSDRVWIAKRGLYFGGSLYPWDGFERVAWADDGRACALRRRGRWRLQRWMVVPVPAGSREAAEGALRQVMPAPTPTL